jgi:hypothetical protein
MQDSPFKVLVDIGELSLLGHLVAVIVVILTTPHKSGKVLPSLI